MEGLHRRTHDHQHQRGDLPAWSLRFDTPHRITGTPWGATLTSVDLGNGLTRHTLTGAGWAAKLRAGASVKVGFSGSPSAGPIGQPAPQPNPLPSPPRGRGYGEALRQSFLFYEAQRSGDLDEATHRIPWRGDSGLRDGRDGVYFGDRRAANLQPGLSLDLSGGYHDAGDHGKFGLPLSYTLSTLAWGGLAFSRGCAASGQLDALQAAVRWGTDYLLKAHGTDDQGTTTWFVAQVGDVAADHALWSAPESQTIRRPALAVTPWKPGSDVAAGSDGTAYRAKALQHYRSGIAGLSRGWTLNWDDASYGAAVLLAQDTGDAKILGDVRGWLDSWVNGTNGVTITAGGLRHISPWGSLRYAANTAMVAGVVADSLIDPGGTYSKLASDTVDYILGDNPRQSSYVVGYGANAPQQPHHRGASGVGWEGFRNGLPNVYTLNGALVGGPDKANDFAYEDVRSDYIRKEVAIDYNAGFSGALAFLAQRAGGL